MAYLRLNRYQIELVKSARVDGKPRTVVLHRFETPDIGLALRDSALRERLEKKAGERFDLAQLVERAQALHAGAGKVAKRTDTSRSMQTTVTKSTGSPPIQVLPLELPAGLTPPKEWKDYSQWRASLTESAYAQALVALYEFKFLYRFEVVPVVYRGEAMLRVYGGAAGTSGVAFPVPVLLSILRHGAAIVRVMFAPSRGGEVRYWEDAEVSCKTFSGEWLSVTELNRLAGAGSSLTEFSQQLGRMKVWLRAQPDVGGIQKGLSRVASGRMRRETLKRTLLKQGAPEFGPLTWPVWEGAIYSLGPLRRSR